jgi:hypothetical protein
MAKAFVAVYTNECKQYCDDTFFARIQDLSYADKVIHVVDNSLGYHYVERLESLCPKVDSLEHIDVAREPKESLFNRNVFCSVSKLREKFLDTDGKYFITVESDVIVPQNLIELFEEIVQQADIIGGIYYVGFHDNGAFRKDNVAVEQVDRTLSGCTLYKRSVVEKIPFRWDPNNIADFPDTFMSHDARAAGLKLVNYNKIKCQHLSNERGTRGWEALR